MVFDLNNGLFSGIKSIFSGGIGNDEDNNENDVIKARDSLTRAGYEAGEKGLGILDRALDTATKAFQKDNGLKIDGVMKPGGETETALQTVLKRKSGKSTETKGKDNNFFPTPPKPLNLKASIGDGRENTPEDIGALENVLAGLGHLKIGELNKGKGEMRPSIIEAAKGFQESEGLFVDGVLKPDGETQQALNKAIQPFINQENMTSEQFLEQVTDKMVPESTTPQKLEEESEALEIETKAPTLMNTLEAEQELLEAIKEEEGSIPHLYKDNAEDENITIGYGKMIPNEDAIKKIDLEIQDKDGTWRKATDEEKVAAYRKLKAYKNVKNASATSFDPTSEKNKGLLDNLRIFADEQERTLTEHLEGSYKELKKDLKSKNVNFDTLPPLVKKGLYDLKYNLGQTKFNPTKWPSLFEAIQQEDWARAAKESRRKGVPDRRNDTIRKLFEEQDRISKEKLKDLGM